MDAVDRFRIGSVAADSECCPQCGTAVESQRFDGVVPAVEEAPSSPDGLRESDRERVEPAFEEHPRRTSDRG